MEEDIDIRTLVITKIFPQFLDTLLLYQAFLLFHSDSVERVVAVKKTYFFLCILVTSMCQMHKIFMNM